MVVFHAGRYVAGSVPEAAWRWGEHGVDAFFVVSGFVMMVATPPGTGRGVFAARRAIRVLPLYWVATLGMAALVLAAPSLFVAAEFTWPHFLQSLVLWPHYNPGLPGQVVPLLVPGWTLSYELYFYALFALCLGLRPGARVAAVAGLLAAMLAVGHALGDRAPGVFLRDPVVFEFVLGMGAGWLWLRGHRCPEAVSWPLAAIAFAAIVVLAPAAGLPWRALAAGVPAMLLAWALASARAPRLAVALGDASYSIYLLHPFVVGAVWFAWRQAGVADATGAHAFIALCLAASAVSGWLAWRVFEWPVTRALRARIR